MKKCVNPVFFLIWIFIILLVSACKSVTVDQTSKELATVQRKEVKTNEKKTLDQFTKDYLSSNLLNFEWKKLDEKEKLICIYREIGKEENANVITRYLMVLAHGYSGKTPTGTKVLVPVVLTVKLQNGDYIVTNFGNPLRYNEGSGEAEKLFPKDIAKNIQKYKDNKTIDEMEKEIEKEVGI